jgi:hypothetical protein
MRQSDHAVRLAAFRFLEEQVRLSGEEGAIRRSVLERGFVLEGERVPLLGPQGIFKPRVLDAIPLSITTVPVVQGEARPYDDAFGPDGLLRYRYRGTDPSHHENRGLRLAMQLQVPLVYFHGIVPGLYAAEWPDRHLHEFRLLDAAERNPVSIGIPTDDDPEDRPVVPGWQVLLSKFFDQRNRHAPPAMYAYHFGDDWQHVLVHEGMESADDDRKRRWC